jgi:hypothetical protein
MTRYALSLAVALAALATAPSADKKPWSAAEGARTLEGRWKLSHESTKFVLGDKKVPALIQAVDTEGAILKFENGALSVEGQKLAATFEIDLNMPEKQKAVETSVAGQRLVRVTPKGGEAFFASYSVGENGLQLRYPAGCCSRSGMVMSFERAK